MNCEDPAHSKATLSLGPVFSLASLQVGGLGECLLQEQIYMRSSPKKRSFHNLENVPFLTWKMCSFPNLENVSFLTWKMFLS